MILEICEETVQMPGMWFAKRWWERKGLDLVGFWVTVAVSEEEGWGEDTDVAAE